MISPPPDSPIPDSSPDEPDYPWPPRFWWLKRIALGSAIFLLLLGGAWFWWSWEADRRLADELAAIRARGEPTRIEDFQTESIPDGRNAAHYLSQAALAMDPNAHPPASTNMIWEERLPYPSNWMDVAQEAVEANERALALARQARQFDEVDWKLQLRSPAMTIPLTMLNEQRSLANLLADSALHAHFTGDDAAAMERIEDVLSQARALDEQPFLISHLVAAGIESLAVYRVKLMATRLSVEDEAIPGGAAGRAQVRSLIDALLDDEAHRARLREGIIGDRVFALDVIEMSTAGSMVTRPLFDLDTVRVLRQMEASLEALERPNLPAMRDAIADDPAAEGRAVLPRLMSAGSYLSSTVLFEQYSRAVTRRRMAAVSLAARLYYLDHGAYPATLEALAPEYLPAVPVDAMASDGRSLGYLLAAQGARPVVYSVVGPAGDDRPLDESDLPSGPVYSRDLLDLTAWQPPEEED